MSYSRDDAYLLLTKYNQDPYHIKNALIVEWVMRYFAKELGYAQEENIWGIVGLLHDLDFEKYTTQHCIKSQEIMRANGIDERIIRASASHGYAITVDIKPEHEMEKVLYAVDELTGLIGAVALMRPSRSVMDLELKSVKKKYKNKNFAMGCSREVIEHGADMLGWTLDDLISKTFLPCELLIRVTKEETMQIYLDNAATTKMSSTSLHAMLPYFNEQYGNPSSLYTFGQKANEAITDAREKIAELLHGEAKAITFTS